MRSGHFSRHGAGAARGRVAGSFLALAISLARTAGVWWFALPPGLMAASDFQGRITTTLTQGSEISRFLSTVGADFARVERTHPRGRSAENLVDLRSGKVTLVFPHNRSFTRRSPVKETAQSMLPGAPAMVLPPGGLPPGIGPQPSDAVTVPGPAILTVPQGLGPPPFPAPHGPTAMASPSPIPLLPRLPGPPTGLPPGLGPQPLGGAPGISAVAIMPSPMVEHAELQATGKTSTILGYVCAGYELKERGETMEMWATNDLMPFHPWEQNRSPAFGPRLLEHRWPEVLRARQLYPLLATLRSETGEERLRFEVTTITAEVIEDAEGKLFQPPPHYHELKPQPL